MSEMTISRLDNYFVLQKQKELFEIKYIPSSISGVDTSKPAVQSNSISNTTENQAIQRLDIDPTIKAEYSRVCRELKALNDYIYSIPDFEIIIHPRCVNFITEISNYSWAKDKFGNKLNVPIDDFNHLMDAMRYGLEQYIRKNKWLI